MDVATEWNMVLAVLSAVLAIAGIVRIGYRDITEHIDKKFADVEANHQRESAAFKEQLALQYVSRKEFSCETANIRLEHQKLTNRVDRAFMKYHPDQEDNDL